MTRDDDTRIDGEIVNGSFSTSAPHVRMSTLRLIRFHPAARFLGAVCLVIVVVFLPAGFLGAALVNSSGSRLLEVVGGLLLLVGNLALLVFFAALFFLNRICKGMARIFENGLLTPGVVVSESPLQFVVLANMNTGFGDGALAVQRFKVDRLPSHPNKVGTRFPCVSYFQDGPEVEVYGSFSAEPLSFATGRRKVLDSRLEKIGEAAFARLEAAIAAGLVPAEEKAHRFLDETPG